MHRLSTEYGFRTADTTAFNQFITDHQLAVPASFISVIDPPTYETLEAMIGRLEAAYNGAGAPSAAPEVSGSVELGSPPTASQPDLVSLSP
jgi:hypothetical protein